MNRAELVRHLMDLLDAVKNQEIIQVRCDNIFQDELGDEELIKELKEFRVKPKPLECWVNTYPDGDAHLYLSEETARCQTRKKRKTIHMREVEE